MTDILEKTAYESTSKKLEKLAVPSHLAIPGFYDNEVLVPYKDDEVVLDNWDLQNYFDTGDYTIIDNDSLDNYEFLDIPKPTKFDSNELIETSYKKGVEMQEARKADRSYWEPKSFVHGAKRVNVSENKWTNENTIRLKRKEGIKVERPSLVRMAFAKAFSFLF